MNFFRLNDDPIVASRLHADHHVRKMPTEACQLLATAHIETIKVLWIESVTSDASRLAREKGAAVSKRWAAGHDRMKAIAQLDIWEDKLKEAKNMIAAWKHRLRGDEDAIAQATIHPHLVDACNPNPESDEP